MPLNCYFLISKIVARQIKPQDIIAFEVTRGVDLLKYFDKNGWCNFKLKRKKEKEKKRKEWKKRKKKAQEE